MDREPQDSGRFTADFAPLHPLAADEPIIRVVRGTPTAEELAALVGVLSLHRAAPPAPATAGHWARSARPAGRGLRPGPGAWRVSGLPSRQP